MAISRGVESVIKRRRHNFDENHNLRASDPEPEKTCGRHQGVATQ